MGAVAIQDQVADGHLVVASWRSGSIADDQERRVGAIGQAQGRRGTFATQLNLVAGNDHRGLAEIAAGDQHHPTRGRQVINRLLDGGTIRDGIGAVVFLDAGEKGRALGGCAQPQPTGGQQHDRGGKQAEMDSGDKHHPSLF